MNLDNNNELIDFFNNLLVNDEINQKAYKLITFFIITRNYGLINLKENIERLYYEDTLDNIVTNTIIDGFIKDNIPYTSENIIKFLITNYHENGFYFHTFPAYELDDIKKNGLTKNDERLNKIIDKYHLNRYFDNYKKITVTDYLNSEVINNTPLFPNLNEIKMVMQKNKNYTNEDYYVIIEKYYNKNIVDNNIGIAFIEKRNVDDYFGKHINLRIVKELLNFTESCHMSDNNLVHFITNTISHNKLDTLKNIPSNLLQTIVYKMKQSNYQKRK